MCVIESMLAKDPQDDRFFCQSGLACSSTVLCVEASGSSKSSALIELFKSQVWRQSHGDRQKHCKRLAKDPLVAEEPATLPVVSPVVLQPVMTMPVAKKRKAAVMTYSATKACRTSSNIYFGASFRRV